MNVMIRETGKVQELSIIDRESGVDWTNDLVGNAGAFNDGQFEWSEEHNAYRATQDTYDWWARYIEDNETTEREAQQLAEELDISVEDVYYNIQVNTRSDYGNHRSEAIQAMQILKEAFAQDD